MPSNIPPPPEKHDVRVDTWHCAFCPKCKKQNWSSSDELDAMECRYYGEKFDLCPELHDEDYIDIYGELEYVRGQSAPYVWD